MSRSIYEDLYDDAAVTLWKFEGEIKVKTDEAILFICEDKEIWLPISQINYEGVLKTKEKLEIGIPEWLAMEKELI